MDIGNTGVMFFLRFLCVHYRKKNLQNHDRNNSTPPSRVATWSYRWADWLRQKVMSVFRAAHSTRGPRQHSNTCKEKCCFGGFFFSIALPLPEKSPPLHEFGKEQFEIWIKGNSVSKDGDQKKKKHPKNAKKKPTFICCINKYTPDKTER